MQCDLCLFAYAGDRHLLHLPASCINHTATAQSQSRSYPLPSIPRQVSNPTNSSPRTCNHPIRRSFIAPQCMQHLASRGTRSIIMKRCPAFTPRPHHVICCCPASLSTLSTIILRMSISNHVAHCPCGVRCYSRSTTDNYPPGARVMLTGAFYFVYSIIGSPRSPEPSTPYRDGLRESLIGKFLFG